MDLARVETSTFDEIRTIAVPRSIGVCLVTEVSIMCPVTKLLEGSDSGCEEVSILP